MSFHRERRLLQAEEEEEDDDEYQWLFLERGEQGTFVSVGQKEIRDDYSRSE